MLLLLFVQTCLMSYISLSFVRNFKEVKKGQRRNKLMCLWVFMKRKPWMETFREQLSKSGVPLREYTTRDIDKWLSIRQSVIIWGVCPFAHLYQHRMSDLLIMMRKHYVDNDGIQYHYIDKIVYSQQFVCLVVFYSYKTSSLNPLELQMQ